MDQTQLEAHIDEAIRRLVEFYNPEKIYLFGSAARGKAGPDSDLDFLVVVPDDTPREVLNSGQIYNALWGNRAPIDVVPWSKTDFEGRAKYVVASLPATVVREGKLVYVAESTAAGRNETLVSDRG